MQDQQPEQPKKRGRKPKAAEQPQPETFNPEAEIKQADLLSQAPKKRGRKPKQKDAAPETGAESPADTAPKKRRGRPPRSDGPQWRDAPAVPDAPEAENESGAESEALFVPQSDDFAYASKDPAPRADGDENIPTSYSTTDEDLLPDNYSWVRDDEPDAAPDESPDAAQPDGADAQQRPSRDKSFERNSDSRQNNGRNKWRKDRFNKNQQQNQQNNRGGANNNRFNRNQNQKGAQQQFGGQQNKNRPQNSQQNQNRANRQAKPKWLQPSLEDDTINPVELFDWDALKSQANIEKYLAKIYFGKADPEPQPDAERPLDAAQDAQPAAAPQPDAPEAQPASQPVSEPAQQQPTQKPLDYWDMLERSNKAMFAKASDAEPAPAQTAETPQTSGDSPDAQTEPFSADFTMRVEDCGALESLENFDALYAMPLKEMRQALLQEGFDTGEALNKNALLRQFYSGALAQKKLVKVSGILDVFENGFGGALTFSADNYRLRKFCVYVPKFFIEKYSLARGHSLEVLAAPPRSEGGCPFAVKICSAMGGSPDALKNIVAFNDLVPYYPTERIIMESPEHGAKANVSMRAVDLLAPVGLGQRALIVAPPRTGKTVLMQAMAKSIRANKPDARLIVLLVDERPEEVTDFKRSVDAEVVASTFDEESLSHVHAAEMVISKARRLVEFGKDVIILLDSITRLARAYNALMPNGGRTMSGGVEANALQKPKKFFGSARNIEGGGSLTIIATALVETGSKMDEVIFEEFKGTGNLELHLDRALSDKRIFPAINMEKTGTRKEELLYHPDELEKIYTLRRAMHGVPIVEAMEMLLQRLKKTKTNVEFLLGLNR